MLRKIDQLRQARLHLDPMRVDPKETEVCRQLWGGAKPTVIVCGGQQFAPQEVIVLLQEIWRVLGLNPECSGHLQLINRLSLSDLAHLLQGPLPPWPVLGVNPNSSHDLKMLLGMSAADLSVVIRGPKSST